MNDGMLTFQLSQADQLLTLQKDAKAKDKKIEKLESQAAKAKNNVAPRTPPTVRRTTSGASSPSVARSPQVAVAAVAQSPQEVAAAERATQERVALKRNLEYTASMIFAVAGRDSQLEVGAASEASQAPD